MPTEVGELEARMPSMAVTGLQRNVIAMAFWCKSDGGQHQGRLPPPKATQHRSYGRFITVLRRDWVVVEGVFGYQTFRLMLNGSSSEASFNWPATLFNYRLRRTLLFELDSNACAFTTTERALANQARRLFTIIGSMLLPVASSSLPRCHTVSPRW